MYFYNMKNLLVLLVLIPFNFIAQTINLNFVDGRVIVRSKLNSTIDLLAYNNSNIVLNSLIQTYQVTSIANPFPGLTNELDRTFRFYFDNYSDIDLFVSELEGLNEFDLVEKEPLIYLSHVPNDPFIPSQWHLTKVQAFDAWDIVQGESPVKIAIVDNAVSTNHVDLAANIWTNPSESANSFDDDLNGYSDDFLGWDVADNDNDPNPPASATGASPFAHGTHCAGIAAGATNNGLGIAGVGYNLQIISVKCTPDNSAGNTLTNAYDGVYYAIRAGADIISMSWGGSSGLFVTGESIIQAAAASDIVLVAAAGNSNSSSNFYPAAYNNVISVAATDQNDSRASFSNYGTTIDISAPGVGIYSTLLGNTYGGQNGTSMACPLVAGVAGLILTQTPSLTASNVENILKTTSDNIDAQNPSFIGLIGAGRVNAFRAVQQISSIDSNDSLENLFVYPTICSDVLNINSEVDKITITNFFGQKVLSAINCDKVNVSSCSKGSYYVTLVRNDNIYHSKLIIQ
jgi:serine protease